MKSKYKVSTIIHTLLSLPSLALSLITLLLLTCIINSTSNNKANAAVDANSTATIRVKSTCSMTATVDTTHTATLINGIYSGDYVDTTDNNNKPYENGIGQTTIQTFCNDPYGYAIYAIGYTGGDEGVANNRNTVLHSNTLANTYDIPTGTATSGDTSNWAMKLTSVTGDFELDILSDSDGSYANYHKIPSSYTKVAQYDNGTDPTAVSASLTTTYAAYISNTQPAGTYTGQVKYVLVHPATSLEPSTRYMQDVDQWADDIEIGEEVVAYDNRDNKSYTVRRMCMNGDTTGSTWQEKEDNCAWEDSMLWMTQNLDFDLNSSHALNSINTDLNEAGSGAYADGYIVDDDVIYWTPANSTITSINTSVGKFNEWINSDTLVYSADPDAGNLNIFWYAIGEAYDSNLCYVNSNQQTCNYLDSDNTVATKYFSQEPFNSNGDHGKVGNYYNWSAAIASSASGSLTSSTYNNVANSPQNSICPRGWRLPTVSSLSANNEFVKLNNIYNSGNTNSGNGLIRSPIFMVRAGGIDSRSFPVNAGYDVVYWSSTVYDGSGAYGINVRSDSVRPEVASWKSHGRSVRCVSDY